MSTLGTTRIEMFRYSQYDNWYAAEQNGGVYSTPVFNVDEPFTQPGLSITEDIINAIETAVLACDAGETLAIRVRDPQGRLEEAATAEPNKYAVDVEFTYTQVIEVRAASAEEAEATAYDRFEVMDAHLTHTHTKAHLLPWPNSPTKGENK